MIGTDILELNIRDYTKAAPQSELYMLTVIPACKCANLRLLSKHESCSIIQIAKVSYISAEVELFFFSGISLPSTACLG